MAEQDAFISRAQASAHIAIGELPGRLNQCVRDYTRSAAQAIVNSADEAIGNVYPGEDLNSLKATADQLDGDLLELAIIAEELGESSKKKTQFSTLYRMWSPRDDARRAIIDLFCLWFGDHASSLQNNAGDWLEEAMEKNPLNRQAIKAIGRTYLIETGQIKGICKSATIEQIGSSPAKSPSEKNGVKNASISGIKLWLLGIKSDSMASINSGKSFSNLILGSETSGISQTGWRDFLANDIRQRRLFNDTENFLESDYEYLKLEGVSAAFSDALAQSFRERLWTNLRQRAVFVPVAHVQESLPASIKSSAVSILGRSVLLAGLVAAIFHGAALPRAQELGHAVMTLLFFLLVFTVTASCQVALIIRQRSKERFEATLNSITRQVTENAETEARTAWRDSVMTLDPAFARRVIGQVTLVKKRPLDFVLEGELTMPADPGPLTSEQIVPFPFNQPPRTEVKPSVSIAQPLGDDGREPYLPAIATNISGFGGAALAVIGGIAGSASFGPFGCIAGVLIGLVLGILIGGILIYAIILGLSAGLGALIGAGLNPKSGSEIGIFLGLIAGTILIIHGCRASRAPSPAFLGKLGLGLAVSIFGLTLFIDHNGQFKVAGNDSAPSVSTPITSDSAPSNTDRVPSDSAQPGSNTLPLEASPSERSDGTVSNPVAPSPVAPSPATVSPDPATAFAPLGSGLSDEALSGIMLEQQRISPDDLSSLSLHALSLSYNTIYAIHGYSFKRPWLREYFNGLSWYRVDPGWSEMQLSTLEKQNLATIRAYERVKFRY